MTEDAKWRDPGQTIRVFVSSTFLDMHAERDVLNRVVFPELRRRCQVRGAEFVGLDLRWGVTEDEIQREGTLAICLREIGQCRPFFVCLLGERFGSVYPPDEVPVSFWDALPRESSLRPLVEQWYRRDDTVIPPVYRLRRERERPLGEDEATALVRYWEVQGLRGAGDSLTAHEIFRGVLEATEPPAQALCYLRRPGLTDDPRFPSNFVPVFVETDEARRQKLVALRTRVRSAGDRLTVHDYEAGYAGLTIDASLLPADLSPPDRAALDDGVVTSEEWPGVSPRLREALEQYGAVTLSGMDAFAAHVTDDLWRAIEPQLARPVVLDAHQRERAYHDRFVSHHTAFFQGRGPERERVSSYIEKPDDREILVVSGEPGAGKSAFLAACVQDARARHPEALVIPHFIGAVPDSASLSATLRSLCETLRREATLDEAVAQDPDKLRVQLRAFLEQAGARRPVILVIDALNQLDPSSRSHELDWLPLWALPGTRIVVSTLSGDCLEQLTRRVPADHVVTIPPLPEDERRSLITAVLARRRKLLTPDQLNALLDTRTRPDAALPLYTLVALEELCLFGEYGALAVRLASLPPTLPELFAQVLTRLERDHARPTVEVTCASLAAARAGLLEAEVLDLLSSSGPFPRFRWTRLYRALEPYLKPIEEEAADSTTGRLDFYHDQLRLAVFQRYLQMPTPEAAPTDAYRSAHRQLAEYFRSTAYDEHLPTKWRSDRVRSLSELPFHQTRAEMWEALHQTLTDFDFLEAKCTHVTVATVTGRENERRQYGGVYELQQDYQRALEGSNRQPTGHTESQAILSTLTRAIARETHDITKWPECLWQQLYNRLRIEPHSKALLDFASNHCFAATARPWFRIKSPAIESNALVRTMQSASPSNHPVNDCALSPDGAWIVAASGDGTLTSWDAATGRVLRTFHGHTSAVNACAVSPDGQWILSASSDQTLKVWDSDSGQDLRTLRGHVESVTDCAISPNGSIVASVGFTRQRALRLWNPWTGSELQEPIVETSVETCVFSADGRRIVAAGDHSIIILDLERRVLLRTIEDSHVLACAISPDGRRIVSAGWDRDLRIWNTDTGALIRRTQERHKWFVRGCSFSPDGNLIVSASDDHTLKVWDAFSGDELATFAGHAQNVNACVFTRDGLHIVSGSTDGTVKLWDLQRGTREQPSQYHRDNVNACAFSPDGKWVVSASKDEHLKIWDSGTGDELCALEGHPPYDIGETGSVDDCAVTPDGSLIVSVGWDMAARLWDTSSGLAVREISTNAPVACCVAPDGELIVIAGVGGLTVWRTSDGRELGQLPDTEVTTCALSTDGSRLISCRKDGTIGVWDMNTRKLIAVLHGHSGEVSDCAVSPDGQWFVSASSDRTLKVWDAETMKDVRTLHGHAAAVNSCAVSPDGRWILSGSSDNTVRLWEAPVRLGNRRELRAVAAAILPVDSGALSVAMHPYAPAAVCGLIGGAMCLSDLMNIPYGPIFITPLRRGPLISGRCPSCFAEFDVQPVDLGEVVDCPNAACQHGLRLSRFVAESGYDPAR